MPKIIEDVEKTIRNCATELFIDLTYTNVDMKMLSKKSGVAVGTIYNYYKNKKQIYLSILKESWRNTFNKLEAINKLTISSKEKLRKFIITLYEDVEARKGLGKILINCSITELKDDKEFNDLKNSLISIVKTLFYSLNKVETIDNCLNVDLKLAESLLVSTLVMLEFHPHDKESNIDFLVKYASLSIN